MPKNNQFQKDKLLLKALIYSEIDPRYLSKSETFDNYDDYIKSIDNAMEGIGLSALNRIASGNKNEFTGGKELNIENVIKYKYGGKTPAYSGVYTNRFNNVIKGSKRKISDIDDLILKRADLMANNLLKGNVIGDFEPGVTMYYNPDLVKPGWDFKQLEKIASSGGHDFYRYKKHKELKLPKLY